MQTDEFQRVHKSSYTVQSQHLHEAPDTCSQKKKTFEMVSKGLSTFTCTEKSCLKYYTFELFVGTFILRTKSLWALLKSWIKFCLSWTIIHLFVWTFTQDLGQRCTTACCKENRVRGYEHFPPDVNDCKEWWKCLQAESRCALLKVNLK